MSNITELAKPTSRESLMISMALAAWDGQNKRVSGLLAALKDEDFLKQVSTDRNRGIYLLGHLIAVNDGLLPLFGLGERMYPELEKDFLSEADSAEKSMPSLADLRSYWVNLNTKLDQAFAGMSVDDWFSRHTAVTEDAFAKEPHRNKLNVLISRTVHTGYHMGQLVFLKGKS